MHLATEWTGFLLSLALMLKTREVQKLLEPDPSNFLAVMPLAALLFNAFTWYLPRELVLPTVSYVAILFLPVFADIRAVTRYGSKKAVTAE